MVQEPWEQTEPVKPVEPQPLGDPVGPEPPSATPVAIPPTDPVTAQQPKTVRQTTRAGVIWTFTIVAIIVAILLVIFMIQNQVQTTVTFLGFQGQLALGIAMLIAAIGGAAVVAISGAVRIIQLRSRANAAAKRLDH